MKASNPKMDIRPEKREINVLQTLDIFLDSRKSAIGVNSMEINPAKNNGTRRLRPIIKIKTMTIINNKTDNALR